MSSSAVDHLWTRPYRWVSSGFEPVPQLVRDWLLQPRLAVMDPAAALTALEQFDVPRLPTALYLVTGEIHVLGDSVAGVFAGPASDAGVELAVDVDRTLIAIGVVRCSASFSRAVAQWLTASPCFDTMQPEDASLNAMEVASALRRIFAQLDVASCAIQSRGDPCASQADLIRTAHGDRWTIGAEAGHKRRRSYHQRELGLVRSSHAPWTDTIT